MSKPAYDPNAKVKLVSNGPTPRHAMLTIGDLMIPFYEADVHLSVKEYVTITVKARLDELQIEAMQEQTRIEVVGPTAAPAHPPSAIPDSVDPSLIDDKPSSYPG